MATQKQNSTRVHIIDVAEKALKEVGRDAITIRIVADAAQVQAPTIYRLFGDKQGLLDAIAEQGFTRYMSSDVGYVKQADLLAELRNGWDFHVKFGVSNPELYALMYDESHYPDLSPAAKIAYDGFSALLHELAQAGILIVSEEHAMFVIFASAAGTVRSLFALPDSIDKDKYCEAIRESTIASVTSQPSSMHRDQIVSAAVTLRANAKKLDKLSNSEQNLLNEWLERLE